MCLILNSYVFSKDVPRNRTVIVGSRGITPGEVWSPYLLGGNHQKE